VGDGGRLEGGEGVADESRGGVRGMKRMCGMGRDENGGWYSGSIVPL